ncbi:MAG: hypothetical protein ACOCQT_06640, partial [Desulfovermiculus sp.]
MEDKGSKEYRDRQHRFYLVELVDWSEAPEWAKWAAQYGTQDIDGLYHVVFFDKKPIRSIDNFWGYPGAKEELHSRSSILAYDWRTPLKRPNDAVDLWHKWFRDALALGVNEPKRFDYYAQKVVELLEASQETTCRWHYRWGCRKGNSLTVCDKLMCCDYSLHPELEWPESYMDEEPEDNLKMQDKEFTDMQNDCTPSDMPCSGVSYSDIPVTGQEDEAFEELSCKQRRKAPWTDYEGNDLYEGDFIIHPSGEIAQIVVLEYAKSVHDKWRVYYKSTPPLLAGWSRLSLQVGDKGMAVKHVPQDTQAAEDPAPYGSPRKSWDKYFLDLACKIAERSTCLRRKVGAVAVRDKRIL